MKGKNQGCFVRLLAFAFCFSLIITLSPSSKQASIEKTIPVFSSSLVLNELDESISAGYFIENVGQLSNQNVRFYTTSGDMAVGFSDSAVLIKMAARSHAPIVKSLRERDPMYSPAPDPTSSQGLLLRLSFEDANMVTPRGKDPLPHPTNFFIGSDPPHWRTNVKSYREVVYDELYDGVDLVYHANDKGVKYNFILAPGTDVNAIRISYEGADSIELDADGNLAVHTAIGDVRDSSPISYQGLDDVHCSFVQLAPLSHGFMCKDADKSREVVIDPLIYSTYLGGGDELDWGYSIGTDSAGDAYVTGSTHSADFPITPGAFDTTFGQWGSSDAFVTKLDSTGSSLIYSTYLGGGSIDGGFSIAIDSAGNAYVTGYTGSADFPITSGAFDTALNGSLDSFVTKLDSTGGYLLYSTYLGGIHDDWGNSLAVSAVGDAYVAGYTNSTDFPVASGAFDTTLNGSYDSFAAKLNATGNGLVYSTYLGGGSGDDGYSIAIDSAGNAYLTGITGSADFPVTPDAFDTILNGPSDAFVSKLDSTGGSLLYSTYIGGGDDDFGKSIAVSSAGSAFVTGLTRSADFPATPGALDTTLNGSEDSFVARLNATGSGLAYLTYLGGGGSDGGFSIAVDSAGNAYVTGYTESTDFPVTSGAFDTILNGPSDAFVAKLDSTGRSLLYSTYFGGGGDDTGDSIVVDLAGNACVAGHTNSADFPVTPDVFDTTLNGLKDAFVAKLSLVNTPPTTDFLSQYWWLLVIIVAVVFALLLSLMMRKRMPKEEEQSSVQSRLQ